MPEGNIEWPPANVGQLIELERRMDEKWELRLTAAFTRLETTMEREINRMSTTMGTELKHVVETREDRRATNRWIVGILMTIIGLLAALNVLQLGGFSAAP